MGSRRHGRRVCGFRSGHLSAVRSPGRVVARQRDRQATLVATERACTRLVYSCRCRFDADRWGEIRIGPPAAGRRESLRAALRPSRISVHGSYSAGDVGRVRPPPRRLVPAPVRTAAPRFLTISTAIFSTYSPSGWTQHAGHVDTGSEYHVAAPRPRRPPRRNALQPPAPRDGAEPDVRMITRRWRTPALTSSHM